VTRPALLARIARFGLARGAGVEAENLGAVADGEWNPALQAIAAARVGGLAVEAVMAGALQLTQQQYAELLQVHEEQLAVDLGTEQMLLRCATTLEDAGIALRVLKGPALAHRFYDTPSLRSFGDGDLLVPSTDFDRALALVEAAGFRRRQAAPRSGFDRRFVKAVTLHDEAGFQLDLHRALTPGPYGVLYDVDAVFAAAPDTIDLGGKALACLSPALTLAHACAHAALGDAEPKLTSLRDVAQLLQRGVGSDDAVAVCERFHAGPVAQAAIARVESAFDVTCTGAFAAWARAYRPSSADVRRLRCYRGGPDRYARQAAATFWVLPTLRDRVAYASALAFPERHYVADRHETYSRRLARSTKLVLRSRAR
jgi:hypothetical protein